MTKFTLPKNDGTEYEVHGTAITPVFMDDKKPRRFCVIQLASGEKVLYIHSRAIPGTNDRKPVMRLWRDAQNMTAEEVFAEVGAYMGYVTHPVIEALGLTTTEVIK